MSSDTITAKPITHQADLAKLPRALGATARAAAVGNLAMDAEAGWRLSETTLHGDSTRSGTSA